MKELDLLLEQYLATDYPLADTAEKTRFAALLQLEDDELLAALMSGDWRGSWLNRRIGNLLFLDVVYLLAITVWISLSTDYRN